jgi:coproporphyrinogen III oxidase-like Fe-S oxidoreductase
MMRYESNRKYDGRKKSEDRQSPAQDNLGFNYYIEQLHQISIEQKSIATGQSLEAEAKDDDALEVFAQVMRLLWQTGEAFLDAFFAEAEHKTGLEMKKIYPALQRMQTAGLVEINEGKVYLTDSGKELMQDM